MTNTAKQENASRGIAPESNQDNIGLGRQQLLSTDKRLTADDSHYLLKLN